MAAGGGAGVITVWNLEKRRLSAVLRQAHDAPLCALHFFAGEPRLMSAAADNSIKQWVFDAADGSGRLLRFRSGHAAPPVIVRHYGEDGTRLLSAGAQCAWTLNRIHVDWRARRRMRVLKHPRSHSPPAVNLHGTHVSCVRGWAGTERSKCGHHHPLFIRLHVCDATGGDWGEAGRVWAFQMLSVPSPPPLF